MREVCEPHDQRWATTVEKGSAYPFCRFARREEDGPSANLEANLDVTYEPQKRQRPWTPSTKGAPLLPAYGCRPIACYLLPAAFRERLHGWSEV